MIAYDKIDERLQALGKNREWLALITPYSSDYIRTVLAPKSTRRTDRVMSILSDAIEKEERVQNGDTKPLPPGYSAIFLNDEELDLADKASRIAQSPSLAAFCHDVIQAEARRLLSESSLPTNVVHRIETAKDSSKHWLDLLGGVAAGSPIQSDASQEPIPVAKSYPEGCYALRVFGDSMKPKVSDHDLIVVQRWGADKGFPKKGKIVVYSDGMGATLKEFGYRKASPDEEADPMGNVPVLRSLNKAFPDVQTMEGGRIDAVFVEVL